MQRPQKECVRACAVSTDHDHLVHEAGEEKQTENERDKARTQSSGRARQRHNQQIKIATSLSSVLFECLTVFLR